ncbi:MAG: PAS domain-containing protein [Bacteroidota bacterium]
MRQTEHTGVLIEKMNEGAVTLHKDGTILYCNSCFAKMVNLPLQKVIGTELKHFIDDSSTRRFESPGFSREEER